MADGGWVGFEDELAVAVEFGAELAGEIFNAGSAGVLDDVLEGKGSLELGAWSLERGWGIRGRDLVLDTRDAKSEPIKLIVAWGDDGEIGQGLAGACVAWYC